MDPHYKGGSHWVALFIDTKNWFLENNQIENFDEFKYYLMSNAKNDFKDFPEMLSLSEEIVN